MITKHLRSGELAVFRAKNGKAQVAVRLEMQLLEVVKMFLFHGRFQSGEIIGIVEVFLFVYC